MARQITLGDRFWSKVDQRSPDECWEWKASKNNKGYGKFSWGHSNHILSHRVAFFIANGKWPTLHVLHTCDNPACNNPNHLIEGTQQENVWDAVRKGHMRGARPNVAGEGNSQAQLTWDEVDQIRKEREEHGTSFNKLAAKYSISKRTIFSIIHEQSWTVRPVDTAEVLVSAENA